VLENRKSIVEDGRHWRPFSFRHFANGTVLFELDLQVPLRLKLV
jgi:hypothetical protein